MFRRMDFKLRHYPTPTVTPAENDQVARQSRRQLRRPRKRGLFFLLLAVMPRAADRHAHAPRSRTARRSDRAPTGSNRHRATSAISDLAVAVPVVARGGVAITRRRLPRLQSQDATLARVGREDCATSVHVSFPQHALKLLAACRVHPMPFRSANARSNTSRSTGDKPVPPKERVCITMRAVPSATGRSDSGS